MKTLLKNEHLGAVKLHARWRFFAGYIGEWILDYQSYDPESNQAQWRSQFRGGLLRVDEKDAEQFCRVMSEREFTLAEVKALVEAQGPEKLPLTVVIDFDERLFVNGYYDRSIEEYVPPGWRGIFDDPLRYVPSEICSVWQTQEVNSVS